MANEHVEPAQKAKFLALALDPSICEYLDQSFAIDWEIINQEKDFQEKFEELSKGAYHGIISGSGLGMPFVFEVAQFFKKEKPETPLLYITKETSTLAIAEMNSNGLENIFLYPIDSMEIDEMVAGFLDPNMIKSEKYRPVRLFDLEPDACLKFDTFVQLPLNKKFVHFSRKDLPFGDWRHRRLMDRQVSTIFVRYHEFSQFCKYTSDRISSLQDGEGVESKTEGQRRLEQIIRGLFMDLFDESKKSYEDGKEAMENCRKIVSSYLTGGQSENIYKDMLAATGMVSGKYSHAAAVSTIATLTALGTSYESPEDIAIAGFYHDISLWDCDEELKHKKHKNSDEQERYRKHCKKSVEFIQERKLILNDKVKAIIQQHHEKYDGTGFPQGREGDDVEIGAQILSFADQLEYLTSFHEGSRRLSIQDAFEEISNNGSLNSTLASQIHILIPYEDEADLADEDGRKEGAPPPPEVSSKAS